MGELYRALSSLPLADRVLISAMAGLLLLGLGFLYGLSIGAWLIVGTGYLAALWAMRMFSPAASNPTSELARAEVKLTSSGNEAVVNAPARPTYRTLGHGVEQQESWKGKTVAELVSIIANGRLVREWTRCLAAAKALAQSGACSRRELQQLTNLLKLLQREARLSSTLARQLRSVVERFRQLRQRPDVGAAAPVLPSRELDLGGKSLNERSVPELLEIIAGCPGAARAAALVELSTRPDCVHGLLTVIEDGSCPLSLRVAAARHLAERPYCTDEELRRLNEVFHRVVLADSDALGRLVDELNKAVVCLGTLASAPKRPEGNDFNSRAGARDRGLFTDKNRSLRSSPQL